MKKKEKNAERKSQELAEERAKELAAELGMKFADGKGTIRNSMTKKGEYLFPSYGFVFAPTPKFEMILERTERLPNQPFAVFMARNGDNINFIEKPIQDVSPTEVVRQIINEIPDNANQIGEEKSAGNAWRMAIARFEKGNNYVLQYYFSNMKSLIVVTFVTDMRQWAGKDGQIISDAQKTLNSIRFVEMRK